MPDNTVSCWGFPDTMQYAFSEVQTSPLGPIQFSGWTTRCYCLPVWSVFQFPLPPKDWLDVRVLLLDFLRLAYLSMSRDSLGVAMATRTATSVALSLSAAALVCSRVISTSLDSSRSQCLQCCDKQGRQERASALLCFSPCRYWISKSYSCNLWIHLATDPLDS